MSIPDVIYDYWLLSAHDKSNSEIEDKRCDVPFIIYTRIRIEQIYFVDKYQRFMLMEKIDGFKNVKRVKGLILSKQWNTVLTLHLIIFNKRK